MSKKILISSLGYYVFENNRLIPFRQTDFIKSSFNKEDGPFIWSARLATGIFGLPSCRFGNLGPKGPGEVILAVDDEGLGNLIRNGFVPCPDCRPENKPAFWTGGAPKAIRETYMTDDPAVIFKLPYDARMVNWEGILPVIKAVPGRLYVQQKLHVKELLDLKRRFTDLDFPLPITGWWDHKITSGDPFTPYEIP